MVARRERRLLYFGMFGTLSRLPLAALLDAGITLAAVVVPARLDAPGLPPIRQLAPPASWSAQPASFAARLRQTAIDLAWAHDIPVLEVARLNDAVVRDALGGYTPDLIAVSCFPLRFPHWLLALPPVGVLNLHPAPLPRGRGPDPLFWLFREPAGAGADVAGVTVHLMDQGLDSGPIVLQERFPMPDGMSGQELELRAAALGAELLTRSVEAALGGVLQPRPQDEAIATTYPLPTEADYEVTPDRPARWAFNFLRGTASGGFPHQLRIGDRSWLIRAARGYEPEGTLHAPYVEAGETLRVRCTPGILTVTTGAVRT
jgi:methionyl-tRNA formyltransferase